jgi:menaquinone-specific isochorismate synthase
MEHFPIGDYGGQDSPEGLIAFLKDCQRRAIESGSPKLVNISLDVFHIDPLAVLEAVYEPSNQHFFMENPGRDESIAAIEHVLKTEATGTTRFEAIREWATSLLRDTIYTGNTESAYCGIHFFCAFNFFDEGQDVEGFPAAQAFVPTWQVSKKEQESLAIANCMIDANTPVDLVARKILGAHQRFASFPYEAGAGRGDSRAPKLKFDSEVGGAGSFEKAVDKATNAIESGDFEKIVLARALDFKSNQALDPIGFLERLRNRFQSCYTFSYSSGEMGTFIGSTPELLIAVKNGRLRADAIAGSRGRGHSASEDAALGAELLNDDKDAREHQSVVRSITKRLEGLGLTPEVARRPRLLKLPNVQHLFTPVEASLPKDLHILDVIQILHPTPAVGGAPRENACGEIHNYEAFVRGPYAGPVGWFDARGDGEFVVGIRSGILRERSLRLFSGAGIVRGSVPEKEKEETDFKFNAIREIID